MRFSGQMMKRRLSILGSLSLPSLFLALGLTLLASRIDANSGASVTSASTSQPGIVLTKTVSLDPELCGDSKSLAVPRGYEVTYCYTIKNNGTISFSQHQLVDNTLGILVDETFALNPGGTHSVTATTIITVSTMNTATWTAYNPGPVDIISATDSAQVQVVPAALITVAPKFLSSLQGPYEQAFLSLEVGNLGDVDLLWSLYEEPALPARANTSSPSTDPASKGIPVEVVYSAADCSKYLNYAGPEPIGYAEWCMHSAALTGRDQPVSLRAPTDIAYAHDVGFISDNFVWHYLNDFPGQVVVGLQPALISGYDFDVTGRILYGLNFWTRELGTVDLSNGAFQPIGVSMPISTSEELVGLTIHPVTGEAYAATTDGLVGRIYSIDLSTGALTFIGGDPQMPFPIDIAISPEGVMYGHDISTDSIYKIDVDTGSAALIGPTNVDANFSQGMDFDNYNGTLYAWIYEGGGLNQYGTINLDTGALTTLAIDDPTGEFEGATRTPLVDSCQTGFNNPWMSVDLDSGTVKPGSSQQITVTLDSTDLPAGVYDGVICIESNDFFKTVVRVPITLEIESFAAIDLRKTVGLLPNVCADTDVISTRAGTRVYYCYKITNSGSVPFSRHSLVDTQFDDPIIHELSATLLPGRSMQPIVSAFITATTVNTATWTAFNPGLIDLVSDTDSAKVLVSTSATFLPFLNRP